MEHVEVRKKFVGAPLVVFLFFGPDIRHVQADEGAASSDRSDVA